jgi:hypothetical protein
MGYSPNTWHRKCFPRPDVLVREIRGESVLLDLASESYFGLDDVGTAMWRELVASPSIDEACRALVEEYDVAPEVLKADLERFVSRLVEAGLVEVRDA